MQNVKVDTCKEFVDKYYNVKYSNVEDIENARIIGLGDVHYSVIHAKVNAEFLKKHCNENDLVVVEAPVGGYLGLMGGYVRVPAKVEGWDLDNIEMYGLNKKVTEKTQKLAAKYWELLIVKYPEVDESEKRKIRVELLKIKNDWIDLVELQSKEYSLMNLDDDFQERQDSLEKVIENGLKRANRVFVMAGESHLFSDHTCKEVFDSSKYLIGLNKLFDKNQTIMLQVNDVEGEEFAKEEFELDLRIQKLFMSDTANNYFSILEKIPDQQLIKKTEDRPQRISQQPIYSRESKFDQCIDYSYKKIRGLYNYSPRPVKKIWDKLEDNFSLNGAVRTLLPPLLGWGTTQVLSYLAPGYFGPQASSYMLALRGFINGMVCSTGYSQLAPGHGQGLCLTSHMVHVVTVAKWEWKWW